MNTSTNERYKKLERPLHKETFHFYEEQFLHKKLEQNFYVVVL
jgi:hypothetical protein